MIEASSGMADILPALGALFAGLPFLPVLGILFGIAL